MKVVFVCIGFPKISETFIYDQVRLLLENNIDVKVLTPHIQKEETFSEAKHFAPLKNYKLKDIVIFVDGKSLLEYENNLKNDILPRLGKVDIYHFHFLIKEWEHVLKYLQQDIPKIVETHGFDITKEFDQQLPVLCKLIRKFDVVVVQCREGEDRANIIKGNVKTPLFYSIKHGIDMREFPERKISLKRQDCLAIMSVGRLVEKKGFEFLIQAMRDVIDKHPHVVLRIYGDGQLKERLNLKIKELNLSNNVFIEGSRYHDEIKNELQKADIFVLSCVMAEDGDMDMIPTVLQEAQALKIPVVSSWLTGIPEIVDHGKSGILVQPKDIQGISQAINLLIERADLRKNMGEHGRRKIERELDMNKNINKYIEIYNNLTNKEHNGKISIN